MAILWKIEPLNSVCSEIIDCVNKTAPVVDYETTFRMIRTTNVKNGRVDLSSVRYVTEETYKIWTRRTKPRRNDIILTREAPLGEVGLLRSDDNIFLGQRLVQYRANTSIIDQLFLYYAFQDDFMQGQIRSYGSGATVEHLRIGDCETFKVKYPPLPIQTKIASILSTYDELIENNKQRIKLLEEMAEEIYKEWFVRLRFPGYETAKFFNEEGNEVSHGTVGALPEGWKNKVFKALAKITMGLSPKGSSYNEESIGFPLLNGAGDFKDGIIIPSKYTTDPIRVCKKGDLVFCIRGTIGHVTFTDTKYCIGRGVASLCLLNNHSRELLYFSLKNMMDDFNNIAGGAVIIGITKDDLFESKVVLPSDEILQKFSLITASIIDEKLLLQKKNQLLQQTRDLLLPRLISGKLSVEHLVEEEEIDDSSRT